MKLSKDFWIIQVFALLHAGVAFGCRLTGIADDLLLTLLTMLMVMVLCIHRRACPVFMAIARILVNIAGFLLGKGLAWVFGLFGLSPLVVYPLSTFICTEIIGFASILTIDESIRRAPHKTAGEGSRGQRWLLFAFIIILILRLALSLVENGVRDTRDFVAGMILDYVFTIVALVILGEYAIRSRGRAQMATEEAGLAKYRYLKLKHQVNPHFLFNSLNVLDYLILEQPREDASRYTRKLAEVYRYMIHNEDETLVTLRDEMGFVSQYADLLKVRFPEGLDVRADIPEADLSRSVIPCSVQLLLENAIKHNVVSASDPLVVGISSDGDFLEVTNRRIPKINQAKSTGFGLKYIRQQYMDLSGRQIQVLDQKDRFTVKLPLL